MSKLDVSLLGTPVFTEGPASNKRTRATVVSSVPFTVNLSRVVEDDNGGQFAQIIGTLKFRANTVQSGDKRRVIVADSLTATKSARSTSYGVELAASAHLASVAVGSDGDASHPDTGFVSVVLAGEPLEVAGGRFWAKADKSGKVRWTFVDSVSTVAAAATDGTVDLSATALLAELATK